MAAASATTLQAETNELVTHEHGYVQMHKIVHRIVATAGNKDCHNCTLTSIAGAAAGEHAVQHSQGAAGPARPRPEDKEEGADQEVSCHAIRAGGAA